MQLEYVKKKSRFIFNQWEQGTFRDRGKIIWFVIEVNKLTVSMNCFARKHISSVETMVIEDGAWHLTK